MPEDLFGSTFVVDSNAVVTAPVEVFDTGSPRVHSGEFMIIPIIIILN